MNSDTAATNYSIKPGDLALVTGASGFTGSVLVRKLLAAGARVRAVARPSSKLEHLKDLDIEWLRGEVFDEQIARKAAAGARYIFHLAAAYREPGITDDTYYKVHVTSTRNFANAALANPDLKRFVHVSTVGVHGHIDNPPADENYRFAPGDVYQNTKAEAELWLRDFAARNNLPFSVIRPAAIYGPGDRRLLKVFKMAARPLFPVLGPGKCLYHLIHVEDLTDGIILAAVHPRAAGEVFICGDQKPTSLMEMAQVISASFGKRSRIIRVPVWPFFIAAGICETLCKPLGISPPIYRRRVAFFTKDRSFNTGKIQSLLGFRPQYPTDRGLSETARWYVDHGWIKLNCSNTLASRELK